MIINFPHSRRTHCETGTIRNLLNFYGYDLSENLIFGIGAGIHFLHFPFVRMDGFESSFFRIVPGGIFRSFMRRMNIKHYYKVFRCKEKSAKKMDELLFQGIPVGTVTSLPYLPYIAQDVFYRERLRSVRFQFGGHNLIVIGKEDDIYYVSDSNNALQNELNVVSAQDLMNARYPKGSMLQKGSVYYIKSFPNELDIKKGIVLGIKKTCYNMLEIPFRFFGIKGMHLWAKRMRNWETIYGKRKARNAFWWIVLQTEKGNTGGGAYRHMYADFLKEAGEILNDDTLLPISEKMRNVANSWQLFALEAVRYYREATNRKTIDEIAGMIDEIAEQEKVVYESLKTWTKKQQNN